jgi:hypothetical protein
MATTNVYVPQASSSAYNESLTAPSGLAPRPLPTSHNYIRPVKQRGGFSATVKDAANRVTSKAQRSMF